MLVQIYLITNEVTGKYYVGQTSCGIEKRFRDHISSSKSEKTRSSPRLKRSMRHHGIENFSIQELASADSTEQGDNLETLWILALDARNPNVGYNLSVGGNSTRGIKWSEESKAELSIRMLGNTRGLGVPCPAEKKAKISAALMGHEQKPNSGSFKKGESSWNAGKRMRKDARENMPKAQKLRFSKESTWQPQ